MKYIGKFFKGLIVALMMAIILIGVLVIFGVKNVNITLVGYSFADENQAEEVINEYKSKITGECSGDLMAFVNENQIREIVDGDAYTLVSFEKFYPCTLNITIRERREAFAVLKDGGTYEIYDDNGEYIRFAENYELSFNTVDNLPNIVLTGVTQPSDVKVVADVASVFKNEFGALRSTVKEIVLDKNDVIADYATSMKIVLSSDFVFELRRYETNSHAKLKTVIKTYNELDCSERLSGMIFCYETERGEMIAEKV